jgi:hypothetical protein
MIDRIAAVGAVAIAMPSAGRTAERRQKRLKWLSSLRAALDEEGALADEPDEDGHATAQARAQIADALSVADEMRGRLGGAEDASGPTVSVADLARRIAAEGPRSLAVQARLGPAQVRRFVDGDGER